jgi:CheY-like chemotaxis protein
MTSRHYPKEEINKRIELLQKARDIRSKETEEHDQAVLDCLQRYQRLSLKQIKEILTSGTRQKIFKDAFLTNSLKRLEDKRLIFSETPLEPVHGKMVKYYFYRFTNDLDEDKIIIPKNTTLTFLDDIPMAYSISDDTIVISDKNSQKYSSQAKFSSPLIEKKISNDEKIFQLPVLFIKFYKLERGTYYFKKEFTEDALLLKKIKIHKSMEEDKIQNTKNILILEDHIEYAKKLVERLKKEGHMVIHVSTVQEFLKVLKEKGQKLDVISLDKRIEEESVAKLLSYEIRHEAPQAKIGILSSNLNEDERMEYQNLDFDFILPKKAKIKTGFSEIGEELVAWLKVV